MTKDECDHIEVLAFLKSALNVEELDTSMLKVIINEE